MITGRLKISSVIQIGPVTKRNPMKKIPKKLMIP